MASRLVLLVLLLPLPIFLEASPLKQVLPFLHGFSVGSDIYMFFKRALGSPDTRTNPDVQRFTLFWPTDEAFSKVSGLEYLSDEDLDELLYGHVVNEYISPKSFEALTKSFRTLAYADVYVQIQMINGSYYVSSERAMAKALSVNGTSTFMAYGIDAVLYVPTPSPAGQPIASSKKLSPIVGLSLWASLLLFLRYLF